MGDAQQHGVDGHYRFAASHIPLQEPVHRDIGGHVLADFVDHLTLPGRQREGKKPTYA